MWQSLLVYNACPQPQTEATVLVSPSLLQIDTFGKWCRCLHNVCYLKLKKRRYLDKCRLSAPADSTGTNTEFCIPDHWVQAAVMVKIRTFKLNPDLFRTTF